MADFVAMFDFELPHLNIIENGEFLDGLKGSKKNDVFGGMVMGSMAKKGSRGR